MMEVKTSKNDIFFVGYTDSNGKIREKRITARTEDDAVDVFYSMAANLNVNDNSVIVYVDRK